jgi:hypothetical protein
MDLERDPNIDFARRSCAMHTVAYLYVVAERLEEVGDLVLISG